MIGLVFADYRDTEIRDAFHAAACGAFRDLSKERPHEIAAVTDPDVTQAVLWDLFRQVDFVFYWGHGQNQVIDGPVLIGSVETERLDIRRIGGELRGKTFFLDACKLGADLCDRSFPDVLIACPQVAVPYETSVHVGCALIGELFGRRRDFPSAFANARDAVGRHMEYRIVGQGSGSTVALSDAARMSVLSCFMSLLPKWHTTDEDRAA